MASAKKGKDNSPEFAIMASLGNLNKNLMESVDALAQIRGDLRRISSSFKQHVTNFSEINTLLKPIVDGGSLNRFKDALDKATAGISTAGPGGGGTGGGEGGGGSESGGESNNERRNRNSEEDLYFRISNQIRILNSFSQGLTNLVMGVNNSIPAFDAWRMFTGMIGQASQAIASMPAQIDSLKQSLLGMGTSLENFDTQFSSQVDNLVGDKFKNLENAATLFSQGFRGNNKGLLLVASKMDLTGQKTSLLTNEFSRMSVLMQLSNTQMNTLALNLDKTSQTFGVKTEQLIQVLGKLKNLEVMSTLGFGGEFANNVKELSAKYKMGEDQMIKLVNALTDPRAFQGLAKADPAIIGLVQQLEKATDPRQFEEVFKEIVTRLDSFAGTLAEQAKSGGLPATVLASQLFGMFGQDLTTASQLARVFTDRLSESEKQLMKEADVTNSLNGAIQKLKTEIAPLITSIVNFATLILQGNNFFTILTGGILTVISTLANAVVGIFTFSKSIGRAEVALQTLSNSITATANANTRAAATQAAGALATGPMAAAGVMLLRFIPWVGVIATVAGIAWPLLSGLFGKDEKDSDNLNKIASNTGAMVRQADQIKSMPQQDTLYSMMARDMAYVITQREQFNKSVMDTLSNKGQDSAALEKLVRIGLDQLQLMNTGNKSWRGR